MSIFSKIRRHAAVAQGNFAAMFRDVTIAPLPEAVSAILTEIHKSEPDIQVLERLISAEPELSVRLLFSVNSSIHSLRSQVTSIRHAITMLGIDRVRSLVMASAMVEAVPEPRDPIFDHKSYWSDTLIRSLLARELACRQNPGLEETAFTAMLLADIAVPVLLESWSEYYRPVLEDWGARSTRLALLEHKEFGWDHGQAGSWILKYWDFPEELVCLVAAHNLPHGKLEELGLAGTAAPTLAVAGLLPSCMNPDPQRCLDMIELAHETLGIPCDDWPTVMESVQQQFDAIHDQFGLPQGKADELFRSLHQVLQAEGPQPCP